MTEEKKEKKEHKKPKAPEGEKTSEKEVKPKSAKAAKAEGEEAKPKKAKEPKKGKAEGQEAKALEGGEAKSPGKTGEAPAGGEVAAAAPRKIKKKGRKNVPVGEVHIQASFNNTIITFTDPAGNAVVWGTSGSAGFKGSRKSTPFAAQIAAETAAAKARDMGMRTVNIFVNGPGGGRESAVRAIQKSGIRIMGIRDVTPVPHNGCRPPKRRRI